MEIKYLKYNQIDKKKWDSAIENSHNGLVYVLSWYLDIVSPGWEALVLGDYVAIMPLPVKRKYGLKYLIQPPFCQQLGVFNNKQVNNVDFLTFIPLKYRLISINLNFNPDKHYTERTNYELDLTEDYNYIRNNYSTNTKRNINKARKQDLHLAENISPQEILNFKKQNPVNDLKEFHYRKLLGIMETAVENKCGESYGITNSKNELLSVMFLINYKERLTFLISSSSEIGKENFAMFLMVDQIIHKYAEKKKVFDFEGGSISNLARFFGSFGAVPVKYYHYRQNNLIWPLNKLV